MFTSTHFNKIAREIRTRVESDVACDKRVQLGIELVAFDLAALFADSNPRFDTDRFINACGIESYKHKAVAEQTR